MEPRLKTEHKDSVVPYYIGYGKHYIRTVRTPVQCKVPVLRRCAAFRLIFYRVRHTVAAERPACSA